MAILIIDNIFPVTVSRWRADEITHYMQSLNDVDVAINEFIPFFGPMTSSTWARLCEEYPKAVNGYNLIRSSDTHSDLVSQSTLPVVYQPGSTQFPLLLSKRQQPRQMTEYKLLYVMFFAGMARYFPLCEKYQLPIVVQLYPGNGLNASCYSALRQMCASPLLRKLIVTEPAVMECISRFELCPPAKVEYIYNVAMHPPTLIPQKLRYGIDKPMLDVCFTSAKGTNAMKGLDVFLDVANQMRECKDVVFHVIGNCGDLDVHVHAANLTNVIKHGMIPERSHMYSLYALMDILVSPSRRVESEIDGWLLGSCVEAMHCGVAIVTTDAANTNNAILGCPLFKPKKEVVILSSPPTSSEIVNVLSYFLKNPAELTALAEAGQLRSAKLFDEIATFDRRARLLSYEAEKTVVTTVSVDAITQIMSELQVDFMGGCGVEKACRMADWICRHQFKCCVEIGVYRGRSLIPQALATRATGGCCYGIDPWSTAEAHEDDLPFEAALGSPDEIKSSLANAIAGTDFERIQSDLRHLLERHKLSSNVQLLHMTSEKAAKWLAASNPRPRIDFLHIDGNHDTRKVTKDITEFVPLLIKGAYIVMNDTNFVSVQKALPLLNDLNCIPISSWSTWTVFIKL